MTKNKTQPPTTNQRKQKFHLKEDFSIHRSVFMISFIFILFTAIIGRAIYIQIYNSEFLQERGNERFMRTLITPSFRGKIYDNKGNILAITNMTQNVLLNSREAELSKDNIKELATLLDISEKFIEDKLKIDKEFIYLKKNISLDLYKKIAQHKFKGIFFEKSQKRFYPYGENVSHVVGFIDAENVGQEGIELEKNEILKGTDGKKTIIKNRIGETVNEIGEEIVPIDGKDVKLTINSEIQSISRKYLLDAINEFNAKAGSAVVINAKTGEILSLVNYPDYNPNSRETINNNTIRNRAIIDIYEPGSTIKPFPVAMAIQKKLINENTIFNTSHIRIGNKNISDTHHYPSLTTTEIIQKSSNIGTVKIAMNLTPEEMWTMFDNLNFGRKIGIGFPGESKGIVRKHQSWKPIEQANMAFGHGMSVNLLQMVNSYQAFTNDGKVCTVNLIKKEDNIDRECKQVFTPQAANKVKEMLRLVTEKGGTATRAQTKYYHVAGKTGTANKVENGKYVSKYIASFIGFAPAQNPEIIVGVMVDEPSKGSYYGGIVAAPVFAGIANDTLQFMNVPIEKMPAEDIKEHLIKSNNSIHENLPILEDFTEENLIEKSILKKKIIVEPIEVNYEINTFANQPQNEKINSNITEVKQPIDGKKLENNQTETSPSNKVDKPLEKSKEEKNKTTDNKKTIDVKKLENKQAETSPSNKVDKPLEKSKEEKNKTTDNKKPIPNKPKQEKKPILDNKKEKHIIETKINNDKKPTQYINLEDKLKAELKVKEKNRKVETLEELLKTIENK